MASKRVNEPKPERTRRPPARTPEDRENQLVSKAVDLAEKQIADGTASSQVVTHFLKLGSTREQLEQERLRRENELLKAKVEQLATAARLEELVGDALKAFRSYAGQPSPESDDEY